MRQIAIKIVEFFLGESPAKRDRKMMEAHGKSFLEGFAAGLESEKTDMPSDEFIEEMRRIYHNSALSPQALPCQGRQVTNMPTITLDGVPNDYRKNQGGKNDREGNRIHESVEPNGRPAPKPKSSQARRA